MWTRVKGQFGNISRVRREWNGCIGLGNLMDCFLCRILYSFCIQTRRNRRGQKIIPRYCPFKYTLSSWNNPPFFEGYAGEFQGCCFSYNLVTLHTSSSKLQCLTDLVWRLPFLNGRRSWRRTSSPNKLLFLTDLVWRLPFLNGRRSWWRTPSPYLSSVSNWSCVEAAVPEWEKELAKDTESLFSFCF